MTPNSIRRMHKWAIAESSVGNQYRQQAIKSQIEHHKSHIANP
jgi:hypothetical protein